MTTRKQGLKGMQQRGFTLLLVLLVLGAVVGAALFSFYNSSTLTLDSDQKTADALARAKSALIGYAVTNPTRPGEFPCPDTDNDGVAEPMCVPGILGRIPWKTLGISELKDSAGETFWYAVAQEFRNAASGSAVINSDTRGSLKVYAGDGSTVLTSEAVAVIFAPGAALGSQTRAGSNLNVAANYLETANGINNAAANGPFIAGPLSGSYNDRLISITTPEFIPAVEMRVAKELKARLDGYRANSLCQCYPWADSFADTVTPGTSDVGVNRGRLPLTALPENWGLGAIPALPSWFGANNWHKVIYYSVAKLGVENAGQPPTACTTPYCVSTTLSVDGVAGVAALFFTPGTPRGAIVRPGNNLADYLEDSQNNDGANDLYVKPTATALDRDRITIFSTASVLQCAQNASALVALAPCGQPPRLNSQCVAIATDLAVCSCAAAAIQMINTPCENTLNPPQCQSAVAALQTCNSGGGDGDKDK